MGSQKIIRYGKGNALMRVLFTICARAGSKGCRNKNIRSLKGIPLVYYTLAAIDMYEEMNENVEIILAVNTDSEELIQQIKQQTIINSVKFIERKKELAGDVVAKIKVIQDTYVELIRNGMYFDLVVDLDLTSPLRRASDISGVISQILDKDYDIAFSVVPSRRSPYFNMVEQKEDGYYRKVSVSNYTARQQAPNCYELNASIYAYRTSFLATEIEKTILDYRCGIWVMPDYLILDIDSEWDFKVLEALSQFHCDNDKNIAALYYRAREIHDSAGGEYIDES